MPEISVARADVAKIYIAAFDRIPDAGGLDFWVSSYMSGENTLESIAQLFTNSTEYKTAYPSSISTAEYVEKIYINVFNRASDADGKKFWVNALTAGALTNGTLMKAMVDAASANGSTDGFMLTNQATFGIWAADNKISFETANAQLSSITYDDSTLANAKSTISTSLTPSSLDLSSADDTGSSYTDNITQNTSALTISGNAAAGSTVKLYDTNGTTLLGTGTATSSGTFSIDVSLSEGTHSLTGKATTTSGTSSSASSTLSITVDKTAPIAHLTSITDNVGSVTGILSSGATTDDTSLAMTGTCESGSTVNIYNGTTLLGTATTSNTSWTYNALVSEGTTYQFNVKETDKAGNISASTSNVTITGASNTQTINAGILNQNTTWESGKTYLIDGVLQINRGVTLTIQSGAKIIGGKIDVFGSLIVDGTSSNKVEITNTTIGIGDNEYTEIALIDIDFANISNSNIYSPTGNSIYGKINLTNSTLTNNEYNPNC